MTSHNIQHSQFCTEAFQATFVAALCDDMYNTICTGVPRVNTNMTSYNVIQAITVSNTWDM